MDVNLVLSVFPAPWVFPNPKAFALSQPILESQPEASTQDGRWFAVRHYLTRFPRSSVFAFLRGYCAHRVHCG